MQRWGACSIDPTIVNAVNSPQHGQGARAQGACSGDRRGGWRGPATGGRALRGSRIAAAYASRRARPAAASAQPRPARWQPFACPQAHSSLSLMSAWRWLYARASGAAPAPELPLPPAPKPHSISACRLLIADCLLLHLLACSTTRTSRPSRRGWRASAAACSSC